MPPQLVLRHFYDPGAGVCLWAANDAARERFGYQVELTELPITPELRDEGQRLMALYDTSLDWDYPPDPSPWSDEQWGQFFDENWAFVRELQRQLGSEYQLLNVKYEQLQWGDS